MTMMFTKTRVSTLIRPWFLYQPWFARSGQGEIASRVVRPDHHQPRGSTDQRVVVFEDAAASDFRLLKCVCQESPSEPHGRVSRESATLTPAVTSSDGVLNHLLYSSCLGFSTIYISSTSSLVFKSFLHPNCLSTTRNINYIGSERRPNSSHRRTLNGRSCMQLEIRRRRWV